MSKLKVINLYGGPGSGKSTMAARCFAELKMNGYNVELVTEYAKDLTWAGREKTLRDQLYILAKQHDRLRRLEGQVELVITDSPLLLCLVYVRGHPLYDNAAFASLVRSLDETFYRHDYFVRRCKAYNPRGRNQTEHEARALDGIIRATLTHTPGYPFREVYGTEQGALEVARSAAAWIDAEA